MRDIAGRGRPLFQDRPRLRWVRVISSRLSELGMREASRLPARSMACGVTVAFGPERRQIPRYRAGLADGEPDRLTSEAAAGVSVSAVASVL